MDILSALAIAGIGGPTIASVGLVAKGVADERALQEKERLDREARRAVRTGPGRLVIVGVGDYKNALKLQLVQMERAGALGEIGLILVHQLDTDLRQQFTKFMAQHFPSIPVKVLEVDDISVGGLHSRERVQNAEGEWGPRRNALVIDAIAWLQNEGIRPAEIWVIDGLGSQPDLGIATAEQLCKEYEYARLYVQVIIADQEPLRSQALAKLEDYRKRARAVLVTDNRCGMRTNDQALGVQQAVRLSPHLDGASVDSGFNLLEDICPAENGGILTIRRVVRGVTVRGLGAPRSDGQSNGVVEPFVKSGDLLFEVKRLGRDVFKEADAEALAVDPSQAISGRRQGLFFLLPATQEQLQGVVSELKEALLYDKVDGRNFYERHPNLVLRFAWYDVPRMAQAECWCVCLFGLPGGVDDLRAAIARRSPAPGPNGHQATLPVAETVLVQTATKPAQVENGRQAEQTVAGSAFEQ